MDITPQILALKNLHATMDLSDYVDALLKYTAARVILDRLLKQINELPEEEKPQMSDYIAGKLLGFIWHVEQAVMPTPDSYKSPREWMEAAGDDLLVVESKVQRE